MSVESFLNADIDSFLNAAAAEGWISDCRELLFLLSTFPAGCFVWRGQGGEVAGFVTAIAYERSGWVGNLLVAPAWRRRGIGPILFTRAVDALRHAGVETIWLTASAMGKPLYESVGFRSVSVIERWRGAGKPGGVQERADAVPAALSELDRAGWGDDRDALLQEIVAADPIVSSEDGFLALRDYPGFTQLGPWGAASAAAARLLFHRALARAGRARSVVADIPAGNTDAAAIVSGAGFRVVGATELMYAGLAPGGDIKKVYALASMGSMG